MFLALPCGHEVSGLLVAICHVMCLKLNNRLFNNCLRKLAGGDGVDIGHLAISGERSPAIFGMIVISATTGLIQASRHHHFCACRSRWSSNQSCSRDTADCLVERLPVSIHSDLGLQRRKPSARFKQREHQSRSRPGKKA